MSLSQTAFRIAPESLEQFHKRTYNNNSMNKSLLSHLDIHIYSSYRKHKEKETPLCTSCKASYTVEATLILPWVIGLIIFILFLLRICMLQIGVQRALDETSQQAAVAAAYETELSLPLLAASCNQKIASSDVPVSYMIGGLLGISYGDSKINDNYIDLVASYEVVFPVGIFGRYQWHICQHAKCRKWIGWDPSEENGSIRYVYVTAEGSVYHTYYDCVYLHPTIRAVTFREIDGLRNDDGRRYSACRACHASGQEQETIYITDYGEVYHVSLGCSSLKRTIYRKRLSEVEDLPLCSKCEGR